MVNCRLLCLGDHKQHGMTGGISAAFEKVARLRVHLAGNSPTPARPATCLDSGKRAIG